MTNEDMDKISAALEHKISPWLRLLLPLAMSFVAYYVHEIDTKFEVLQDKHHKLEIAMYKAETERELLKYRLENCIRSGEPVSEIK